MLSENRLERRTLNNTSVQTYQDYQDTSDDSAIYSTIKLGLISLAGYGLFKSGALKEITRPLLEMADSVAREGGDKAGMIMHTVKQWSQLKNLDASQLARSTGQSVPIPKNSLFRHNEEQSLAYSLFEDAKDLLNGGRFRSTNLNKILRDTQDDMVLLKQMTDKNIANLDNIRTDYTNTKLYSRLREVKKMYRQSYSYNQRQTTALMDETMRALREDMILTDEKAMQQLRESGYRALTLGDIVERVNKDTRTEFVMKQGLDIDLTRRNNKEYASLLDTLNDMANSPQYKYIDNDGITRGVFSDDFWKKLTIDSNMRIDDSGKIIDFRMTHDNLVGFVRSLSTDFKLPLVQFNPLKTLGLDKFGRYKPLVGLLNPNQLDPNITRVGGMDMTLGKWMTQQFGEGYENKAVAIINGKAFTTMTNENGQEVLQKLGEGFKLHNITRADGAYGLKPLLNASRQMSGITTTDYLKNIQEYMTEKGISGDVELLDVYQQFLKENYDMDMTTFQKAKFRLGEWLDLGWQEARPITEEGVEALDTATNIDEITNKFINWLTDKPAFRTNGFEYSDVANMVDDIRAKNYKTMFGEGFEDYKFGQYEYKADMFTTTKEGYKATKALDYLKEGNKEAAKEEAEGFIKQYFVGRNSDNTMNKFFTERSGASWIVLNQLSEGLGSSSSLLGLSIENKKSSVDLFKNLLLKRALPVYAALQVPEMLNYFSEPFFRQDEDGNRDNITKVLMRNVVKPIDIGAHHAMDLVGATKLFKFMGEMTPGSDQINELQGIYQLGLGQTAEEREDYIENGYDPIRKGRWWGAGNTPWTGGKIEYWRPNLYRRVQADVDFSDSKWGSRQEYYSNTWFPNPVNPFAPINHFILDRNHYDKKHYYDRPYLQTSPEGSNIPIIGPLFSQTVGRVINPPQKMHREYWDSNLSVNPADEEKSPLLTEGKLETINVFYPNRPWKGSQIITPDNYSSSKLDVSTYNDLQLQLAKQNQLYQATLSTSSYQAKEVISKSYIEKSGITFQQRSILPIRTYDRYDTPLEVYSTPSGNLTIVDVPDDRNLYNVNQDLQRWSINKVLGTNQRVSVNDFTNASVPVGNDSQAIDNQFMYGLGEQYNWFGEIAGLKGFALQQFVTGHANEHARIVENSGYAYSTNNDFWEENLGGFGGNLSEITRRFIPKRNNSTEYINPIRNTMPSWMPGSNYFTDFKHGDPYSKIMNGEERLPGEGYERLNNIKGLMNFNIGSSSIGYDQAYIVRHMLKQDVVDTGFESDTLEIGTKIHNQIEKAWEDAGIAFSTEGEVKDNANGIIGYYDAMVHDPTSKTGVGIVDIKTTSAKKLDEIRKSGKALDHHQRQVNYYLWGTNNTQSKGYIYYVDKENLNNNYTVGFDYSEDLLKDTLNNVYDARKTIRDAVDKGIIGRGELYKPIDQFRILADVAPYSQEFKDVKARLSMEKLSPEEQEEISAINKRVTQQKEPLRVYDYKFKTSNLKSETVTVQKVIDNNTIVTKEYGKQHSVKFAGINVSMSNSEMYDDDRTRNEAAADTIRKYIRPGQKIRISYDVDEHNKFSKDSTRSIRAVVYSNGQNVNKVLLNKGHAKEKENDDSPAAVHARYSKGEIAFGSAMETLTHKVISRIPFVGSKMLQVRSPYEQYRQREVYGKDFQSWNHPIRDIAIPNFQNYIGSESGIGGIMTGAFVGTMFGKGAFGAIVGGTVGAIITGVGKANMAVRNTKDRDWVPDRRKKQEALNEYVDILKYVKNTKLYEEYKTKALKENNFDVDSFINSKEYQGVENKLRQQELIKYKKQVKLDFKHRDNYNFKYGNPKYETSGMTKKETISAINQEIAELQSARKVTKLPANALKAIEYKQQADKTMYAYDAGDSLVNIMSALPKKERQYFKHFMDAPEEEKQKILRIAPSYLRRALQGSWGIDVDQKPDLTEYFQTHGLPDSNWIGWDENTNLEDVKVKMVHQNNLDPGEFDIWGSDKEQADKVNIPIPMINARNNARQTQLRLQQILGRNGFDDVQASFMNTTSSRNSTTINVRKDARNDVNMQIGALSI